MSQNTPPDIGQKIKKLRASKKLTLDQLAIISGVSKSMLSQIERNKTNPTVGILWSLTQALDIEIGDLLTSDTEGAKEIENILSMKSHQTPEIQSADGKCSLRILGPLDLVSHIEWYEISIKQDGILSSDPHAKGTREHLTVLDGKIIICTKGQKEDNYILTKGDTARYNADVQHYIKNEGKITAVVLLLVHTPS
jgi:XRE family transcriptional regulator, regulator of sulfur utilization